MTANVKSLTHPRTALELRRLLAAFPFDAERIPQLQLAKLRERLADALQYPFYRERFRSAGFDDPREMRRLEDLRSLPLLTRDDLRGFVDAELARDPQRYGRWYHTGTSGSTGHPLALVRTWADEAHLLARFLRVMFLHGFRPLDRVFVVRRARVSSGPDRRWDGWFQRVGIMRRPFVRAERPTNEWPGVFRQSGATAIYGMKSYLVQLAIAILEQPVPVPPLKFCLTAGEMLDPTSRSLLEQAFRAPVIDSYGCTEMNTLAFQAGQDFMWWAADVSMLELTERDPAAPNVGTSVITDLELRGLPLIRYVLGDRLECGEVNGVQVVKRIVGRDNDFLRLADGSTHSWLEFDRAIAKAAGVWRFRIVQESLDRIRVLVLPRPDVDRAQLARDIRDAFEQCVAREPSYEIEYVETLPPDPSGKMRMVISA